MFELAVGLTDSNDTLHLPASHFLVRTSLPRLLILLYFQVNTVVGLFCIMFKISTWLVVFFVPPKNLSLLPFVPLYTICIISIKTVYAIYCIYITATFTTLNSTLFTEHLDLKAVLMGTKSCTKILNFSTRFSCRRRFRNAPYGEKILLMGKSYVWA